MACLLVGLLFLSGVIPVTVVDSRCSGNQITWIRKTSGRVIGCSPCPACPPATEYSIPCSTKAVNGTPAKCVACPLGKFSTKFDNKPCVSCTICSKRYTKKDCTRHRNAVCGGCVAGYHENEVTFSCDECGRCCHDGKDQAPLGCARVGMCKTRPYGCPNPTTNSGTIKQSNSSQTLTSKIKQSRPVTDARTSSSPTKQFLTKSIENKTYFASEAARGSSSKNEDDTAASSQTIILYVVLSVLILIVLILLVAAVKIFKFYKRTPRQEFVRSLSSNYTTSPQFTPAPTPEDRTLEDFVENGHEVVDSVCLLLYDKLRKGMWDFQRVALRFGLNKEEMIAIKQKANIDGGNPTRELLEVLCSKRPKITVRQFAEIVKVIKRNDVYEKLVAFFFK